MSIYGDICLTINNVNNEIKNDTKLFHYFRAYSNRRRLKDIMEHAMSIPYLKIDMVLDFLNMYENTDYLIKYDEIEEVQTSEDKSIVHISFNPQGEDGPHIVFIYNFNTENAELKYSDKKASSLTARIVQSFSYSGNNKELANIVEYTNNAFKIIMLKYLYDLLYIGDLHGNE